MPQRSYEDRFIPFGTFLLTEDGNYLTDDETVELLFNTWTREVSVAADDDARYAVRVQNAIWVSSIPDDSFEWEFELSEDEFDLGQPGIADCDNTGEFRTFDQWIDAERLVLASEYEAWLEADKQDARSQIRDMLQVIPAPAYIYTSLAGVSEDGCRRLIEVCIPAVNGKGELEIRNITSWVAFALDYPLINDNKYGILVSGCGMDMGFHIVNNLAHAIGLPEWGQKHSWV